MMWFCHPCNGQVKSVRKQPIGAGAASILSTYPFRVDAIRKILTLIG